MSVRVGKIFQTASLHRDHSILYALVCEKEISHMGKNNGDSDLVCENIRINHDPRSSIVDYVFDRRLPGVMNVRVGL